MKKLVLILKSPAFWFSLIFLIIAVRVNFFASGFIQSHFPNRPAMDDLLFRLTPYVPWLQYASELANVLSVILIALYVFPKRSHKLPFVISAFALGEFLRGFMIMLTPMGGAFSNTMRYGLVSIFPFISQHGEFPSGHTFVVAISALLIQKSETPILKYWAYTSVVLEIIALILSRGHYSIDIAGGLLLAYFTYHELKRFEPKLAVSYNTLKKLV